MSKNTTTNLASQLQQKQSASLYSQQSLLSLQPNLNIAQNSSTNAANQLSQLQITHAAASNQLSVFNTLTSLFDQYRELKGIPINPNIVITKTISAEELASTDILKEACKSDYHEGFDLALNKISNIDFQDQDGKTILMHAINNGFYYGVDKLLQKGANVDLVDKQGANALIYSAQIPHIKYTAQIAERTTDINLKAPSFLGSNALHLLLLDGNKTVFASELNGELSGTIKQNSILIMDEYYTLTSGWTGRALGKYPMCIVCSGEDIDLGFISYKAPQSPSLVVKKPVLAVPAVHEKTIKLTKFLIEQCKADVNTQDNYGQTPLLLATAKKLFDVAELLVVHNALDLPSNSGAIALKIAIDNNAEQKLIDILTIKQQVDPETVKLWVAARKGDAAGVEQQITKGVDPDSTIGNYDETTALIQAVISGSLPTVTTILNSKADINKPDKDLASPLYYSLGYGGQAIQANIVKFLVNKGANVSQAMNDGDTPLHMSSYKACVGAMKLLLDHGAKVDVSNNQGKTSLHVLIEQKGLEDGQKLIAVKYLLCKSSSPTLKDGAGHNAIELAQNNFPEASNWLEHPEVLPTIEEFEASIIGLTQEFIM